MGKLELTLHLGEEIEDADEGRSHAERDPRM